MDERLRLVLLALQPDVNVRDLCAAESVAPSALYAWRRRYLDGGLEALAARSRRPHRSPNQTSASLEDEIVRLRKKRVEQGLDAGALSINSALQANGLSAPSRATIARMLSRRGLIEPQPQKRPKSTWRRFEWPRPNDLWQIDMTQWALADGTPVEIIDIIDDHSRFVVSVVAFARTVSCEDTWTVLHAATQQHSIPARLVSDNGLIFTGKPLGFEVSFEARVRDLGVYQITSSPYHPQTCGKLERFHQTLKKHLRALGPAVTLQALQSRIDSFIEYYNHQRPHQGITRAIPAQRYHAQPKAIPLAEIPDRAPRVTTGTVSSAGHLTLSPWRIGVGVRWTGTQITVIQTGYHVQLYDPANRLIHELDIDPDRTYQPQPNH